MEHLDSMENIKNALIKACINSRPSYFKPFLLSDKVTTDWPDKDSFYKFFKYKLADSKKIAAGDLHLKVKFPDPLNPTVQHYDFYDKLHIHSRLTILVEEFKESIHLDIPPF
jgi:hypothetical protein